MQTRVLINLYIRLSTQNRNSNSNTQMPILIVFGDNIEHDRICTDVLRTRWFAGRFAMPRLSFRFAAITRLRSGSAVPMLSFVLAAITRLRSGSAVPMLSFVLATLLAPTTYSRATPTMSSNAC